MWRFLLPGFAMAAAMLLLLAGALGDLEAWRHWPTGILTQQAMRPADAPAARPDPSDQVSRPFEGRVARAIPPPPLAPLPPIPLVPTPSPAAPPPAPPQPEAAAPAKETPRPPPAPPQPQAPPDDKRQDGEAAKQQANQIREALDRIRTRHAAAPEPPAATQPISRPAPTQPMPQPGATRPMPVPTVASPTVAAPAETPQQSLVAARAALAMRRGDEAKRLLGVAQFRILFRRPRPEQPRVMVDQRPAAAIAHAAASLDVGDYNAADRSIAFALTIMDGGVVGR